MVNPLYLYKERMNDVMADEFKVVVGKKMSYIIFAARKKIISTDNILSFLYESVTEVASEET